MYAVIETGGKQYKVAVGDVVQVEKLSAEAGATITLDRVLMVADGDKINIGSPVVAGASVSATVKEQGRGEKIRIFKRRRRKHYRKQAGHRQSFTALEITKINA